MDLTRNFYLLMLKLSQRSFSTQAAPFKHILTFGAPGVGKGTYGKLIQQEATIRDFMEDEYA